MSLVGKMQASSLAYNRRVDERAVDREPATRTMEDSPAEARRNRPGGDYYLGLLLSLVWLLFLVLPIRDLLDSNLSLPRLLIAFVAIAVFVAVYLWLVLGSFLGGFGRSNASPSAVIVALGVLTLLVLFLSVFYSGAWLYFLIFSATSSAMRLPTRQSIWTILGLMVLAILVGWFTGSVWQNMMTIELLVGGTGLSMVGMRRMIFTIMELRAAREEVARLAVSEERLRFARDLHDLLGHSLSLIALKSELAGRLLPDAPEKAVGEVQDIEDTAREALREVREAVAGYRRPTLATELEGAREMLAAAGIGCRIENIDGNLSPQADTVLAWTVREGVTNVIRHSRADHCEIRVAREGAEARAEVVDDGPGPLLAASNGWSPDGSGLRGLAERVEEVGGRFEYGPREEGGYLLGVGLPPGDVVASTPSEPLSAWAERRR